MKKFYEEFKTPIIFVILVFLAFFVYTKLAGPIPFYINSVQTTKTDLFTADGEGTVTAAPDTAEINLGVTTQASTVSDAQSKANSAANKIINGIKKLGISDKDIKTINYSITPNYGQAGTVIEPLLPSKGGGNITGYTVTQNLQIKVTPIDKVNNVIDLATSNGANLIGGINFTFSDSLQKTLENEAMQQAVANAKQKAQSLAEASGIGLGKIVNVVQNSNYPRPIAMGGPLVANSTAQEATPSTNITPGQNTVTVDVVLYYETY